MKKTIPWLVALCAALAIAGAGRTDDGIWLHYLFKPLTTVLMLGVAWFAPAAPNRRYRFAIIAGMAWSLFGDIFLMLPPSVLTAGFICGLASFLVAHICFLLALTSDVKIGARPTVFVVFGLFGIANLAILWPYLGADLRVPVVVYVSLLVTMGAQAVGRGMTLGTPSVQTAALGGALFLLSDTLLAYNRFYTPLPFANLLILGTYYAAVWQIVRSIREDQPIIAEVAIRA